MLTEAERIIGIVVAIFDRLNITYMIGGSVASGIHGVYRYTNDIDIAAEIPIETVPSLVAALVDFYADADTIRDAVETNTTFSIIHMELIIKVDVYLKERSAWADEVWRRRTVAPISTDGTVSAYLPSAEDAILQKLRWFQMGNRVSDRQWSDILGMLKTQGKKLDFAYLREWGARLELSELLDKAIDMASVG